MYAWVYVCAYVCTLMWRPGNSNLDCHFSGDSHLGLSQSLSLTLNSSSRPGWLADRPQPSARLHLLGAGITSTYYASPYTHEHEKKKKTIGFEGQIHASTNKVISVAFVFQFHFFLSVMPLKCQISPTW